MPDLPRTLTLHVLIRKEEAAFVANCLDFGLAAHGSTLLQSVERLLGMVMTQVVLDLRAKRQPFIGFRRAAQALWDIFDEAEELPAPEMLKIPGISAPETISVPPAYMIDAVASNLRLSL